MMSLRETCAFWGSVYCIKKSFSLFGVSQTSSGATGLVSVILSFKCSSHPVGVMSSIATCELRGAEYFTIKSYLPLGSPSVSQTSFGLGGLWYCSVMELVKLLQSSN